MTELAEGARLEIVCAVNAAPRVRIPLSPPLSIFPRLMAFSIPNQQYRLNQPLKSSMCSLSLKIILFAETPGKTSIKNSASLGLHEKMNTMGT
jgi:hypothetical protein